MQTKRVILLTTTWPHDFGETFLDTEARYLAEVFDEIHVFPLYAVTSTTRTIPPHFILHPVALKKDTKQKAYLLFRGIFSSAPLWTLVKCFFEERAYHFNRIWNFMTALLTFRAAYPILRDYHITKDDIVYSYWGDKWALCLPFLKQSTGCRTIARFHGSDLYDYAKKGYIPFRKLLLSHLDSVCPISNNGKEYLLSRYQQYIKGSCDVFRLGVVSSGINPSEKSKSFHILSCSNAIPLKRLNLIADSLKHVDFPIHWTHIGDGPTLNQVKKISTQLPKNVSVDFLGRMPNNMIMNLYVSTHIDLFVNVSTSEGVPVSIMEALSAGIPILATNVGGTGELVNEMIGKLVDANLTEQDLARVITDLYHDQDLNQKRINARKQWETLCSADVNYKAFCKYLQLNSISCG